MLLAAAEEFATKGYAATSYSSIGERLGLERSRVQNYMPSKAEFAAEIAWEPFRTGLFLSPEGELAGGVSAILSMVTHVAEQYVGSVTARASIRLMSERDLISAKLPIPFEGWLAGIERLVREAIAAGELPAVVDVEILTQALVGSFEGNRRIAEERGQRSRLPEYARRSAEYILAGASFGRAPGTTGDAGASPAAD